MPRKPVVLVIDDNDERLIRTDNREIQVQYVSPDKLDESDLYDAHVVILDYKLEHWPSRTNVPFACNPRDGLALMGIVAAHLREMEERHGGRGIPPTALALYSGNLAMLARTDKDKAARTHLIARTYGLEWAFHRHDVELNRQVPILAKAVNELPEHWPTDSEQAAIQLKTLMCLHDRPDEQLIWSDVLKASPPLYELSRWTDGVAIIRWLLHRVLPYPTFLWMTHQLAARLRVKHEWLLAHMQDQNSPLSQLFKPAKYTGILAGFLGDRWWGAGLETILWNAADGRPLSIDGLHKWLEEQIGEAPERLPEKLRYPVMVLDEAYNPLSELASIDDSVRIHLDDWPAHAEPAWITIQLACEVSEMQSRVIELDRAKLDIEEDSDDEGTTA